MALVDAPSLDLSSETDPTCGGGIEVLGPPEGGGTEVRFKTVGNRLGAPTVGITLGTEGAAVGGGAMDCLPPIGATPASRFIRCCRLQYACQVSSVNP